MGDLNAGTEEVGRVEPLDNQAGLTEVLQQLRSENITTQIFKRVQFDFAGRTIQDFS